MRATGTLPKQGMRTEHDRIVEILLDDGSEPESDASAMRTEEYAQIYLGRLDPWLTIGNLETRVFFCIAKLAHFNTGKFFWNPSTQAAIAAVVGAAPASVDVMMRKLRRKGITEKVENGCYRLAPSMCWKGSKKVRKDFVPPPPAGTENMED